MQFLHSQFWWISLIGILLAAIVLTLSYRRVKREVSSRTKIILIALRTLAIGLLLICLLEPMLVAREKVFPRANLLIAVDTSQSMSINDVAVLSEGKRDAHPTTVAKDSKITRIDAIANLLSKQDGGLWDKLADRFDIHLYSFDSECKQINQEDLSPTIASRPLVPQPNLTDIGNTILETTNDWRGQPIAGLVLLTDGNHNVGTDPISISKSIDVPIYTVGVGDENPPKDVKIAKVRAEPVVYVGNTHPIEVVFESNGYDGDKVQIQLLRDDSIIDVASATLDDSNPTQAVKFEIESEKEGNFRYTASISNLPEELTYKNNQHTFFIKSIKAKLRVFYLDSRPRWEYTFLKRALKRDANIEADCTILSDKSPRELLNSLLAKTEQYYPQTEKINEVQKFPNSTSELNSYDVLVFGDIAISPPRRKGRGMSGRSERRYFTKSQIQQITDFVEKRGKALVFLGGETSLGRDGFVNSGLKELLPVITPASGAIVRNIDFNPSLTYEGLHHPITRLESPPASNKMAWRGLPPLSRFYGGLRLRAGATVLAEYVTQASRLTVRMERQKAEPIIVFQRYGAGKTLLIAVDELWNWAFGTEGIRNETGDLYYLKFWAQTIRWMATQSDAKLVNLETDKQIYNLGDEVKITAYVYDESYAPLNDADLEIAVIPPENDRFEIRPLTDEVIDGLYSARFKANQKGTYTISADASYAGTKLGTDSVGIVAEAPILEFENPQQNVELLEKIANLSGGAYIPIAQSSGVALSRLSDLIKYETEPVTVTRERTLWDNPIILILAVVILGIEWIIRKQKGLV